MFGYINVKKDTLTKGQYGMWHVFLCGLCMSYKALYGNTARLLSSFDINFFNVLLHSVAKKEAKIEQHRCVASPFKKRGIMQRDDITDRLATANLLLLKLNAEDDVKDEPSLFKQMTLNSISVPAKKAIATAEELYNRLAKYCEGLFEAEKNSCDNIDLVCDFSAQMVVAVAEYGLGNDIKLSEELKNLCYNTGKWIYLIDALDDLKKDNKKNNYNPLICWKKNYVSSKQFCDDNREELEFLFFSTLNKIAESFNDLNLNTYTCVLKNIIYENMRQKTLDILQKDCKIDLKQNGQNRR